MIIRLGNILFHYRNFLFPLFYAALFIPSGVIFSEDKWAMAAGALIIASGIMIRGMTIGLVYIIRGGRNRQIYAEDLVTGGMYSLCRNPMYLGNILLIAGFGIFANSLLFSAVFTPLFILFYYLIIRAEENFLLGKFGDRFNDYKASTNALFPNPFNLGSAFEGHSFSWKKVAFKEYNSLFIYCTGILLLLIYRGHLGIIPYAILQIILLSVYLIIKYFKHRTPKAH
jgi:protein-S-isoprenylcysteine O-methyltransferase Ste14